jgi:hypothetical protein
MTVAVHEISNGGVTTYRWLCPEHVKARRAAKWTVKVGMPLPDDAPCDDCIRAEQAASDYSTPTVEYVTTSPGSRLPPYVKPKTKPTKRTEGLAA